MLAACPHQAACSPALSKAAATLHSLLYIAVHRDCRLAAPQALAVAYRLDLVPPHFEQPQYNMFERQKVRRPILPACSGERQAAAVGGRAGGSCCHCYCHCHCYRHCYCYCHCHGPSS